MNMDSKNDGALARSARRRARARAELLAAARRVFATKGYHDATIADITRAADVSVGAFYLHFHDKEAAFQAILTEGMAQIRATVLQALSAAQVVTLATIIRAVLQHAYAERDLFRLTFMSSSNPLRPMRLQRWMAESLGDLVGATFPAQDMAVDLVQLHMRFLTGSLVQAIAWWTEHDISEPDAMAEHLLLFLQQGLPPHYFTPLRWSTTFAVDVAGERIVGE